VRSKREEGEGFPFVVILLSWESATPESKRFLCLWIIWYGGMLLILGGHGVYTM
jgi:hypothetical protein